MFFVNFVIPIPIPNPMKVKIGWLLLALVSPALSFGQEIWSLERCLQYAKDNNIQIKQSKLQVDLAEQVKLQSTTNFLPSLNGQATNNYNFGQTIDPFTNQFASSRVRSNQLFLSSSVILFGGFQNWNNRMQSSADFKAANADTEKMMNDVSLNIVTAYLQIIFGKELLKNADNQLEITRLQRDRISTLVKAGQLAESNLFDIEAQFARDELAKVNAENNLNLSYIQLYNILQLDIESEIEVQDNADLKVDGTLLSTSAADMYNAALNNMPEIKAQEYRLKSAEYARKSAYGAMSPRLSFNASIGSGYSGNNRQPIGEPTVVFNETGFFASDGVNTLPVFAPSLVYADGFRPKPFRDQLNDNFNKSIGFSLTIPLFNGLNTNTNIKRAVINNANQKLQLDAAKNTLQQTVQRAYNDALAAIKQYQAAQKLVVAQKESFKYAEIKYQQNLINLVEYTDAKIKLANAENDLVRAKYDSIFKSKIIDFYLGKGLTLN